MTRIAILDDYRNEALECADWSVLGDCEIRVFDAPFDDEKAVAVSLAGFEVAVAMRERTPFPASLLEKLGDLRLLVTTGMRNFSIDIEVARALGITVAGTRLLPTPAFEHAWALILGLMKKISVEDAAMHKGGWQTGLTEGLSGKTLAILGLGKLGTRVAKVGQAFDMKVIAWSQNLDADTCAKAGVTLVDKDELFSQADVLTVHMVLSERSQGLVGAREIALMKPTAYLVNTSRGPIVDEAALIAALEGRTIAGAGIDVYETEPLPAKHPLRDLDNALLTGHTGYVMKENFELAYTDAVDDIRAWLADEPVRVLNSD
jgi:phosphoglycerate dehydrogenase-like enzyme